MGACYMEKGFIDFCAKLFPSIDPYTKEQAQIAMSQFENHDGPKLTTFFDPNELDQGDIFSEIPFVYVDDNGEVMCVKRKALLLSNSCDASRDDKLLFAAIQDIDNFEFDDSTIDAIKKNRKYNCFYIPDAKMKNKFVDFELIMTYSRKAFLEMLANTKVSKELALNEIGYFMFLCKMTIFFMRREDLDVYNCR